MKRIKAIKMATGGLMSQPPYIAKQDKSLIEAYDVNTPASAREGLPSRAMSSSRTRMKDGGLLAPRLKFETGDSVKDKIEARKFEKLEAMKDSGLDLTPKQEQELESYKAKDRKVEMALGGEVVEKYSTQRADYQAYAEGGEVEDDMDMEDEVAMEDDMDMEDDMAMEDETSLLEPIGMEDEMPMDEEMEEEEEDYGDMDAIIDTSALSEDEEKILDESIDMHPELEAIIPKLVATEFTEDGEVDGPGTGTSDSIPALLSDGEFVFTAKAVKNLGVDKLRKMMKQAEESYDAGNSSQEEEV
tara:strand:+ start:138 stop:1040 length:903 start_codon:yes stop_codon:yes gene_type:complete